MEAAVAQVLAANHAFYEAHEARDLVAMRDVWEQSDRAVCVHPGWPILRTWPAIDDSWRRIFAGPGRNQFITTNEAVAIDGDMAWVTLEENLVDVGSPGVVATGAIAATNVFARGGDGRWRLVVHHGSPMLMG
jgi:ketosteroid isomerase-like protein